MPDSAAAFDFHGAGVELVSSDAQALEQVRRHFEYFSTSQRGKAGMTLELRHVPPPQGKVPRRALWRWRSARIAQQGSVRTVDYDGRALLEYDLARERGVLFCPDKDLAHELAYLAVLSRVGERLDRDGLHRVHALGFSYRGEGGLLLLPSGGGKSRLALELVGRPGFGLLSDDIPLLESSGRTLRAFPTGIGLRDGDWRGLPERFLWTFIRRRFGLKRVVSLEFFREKVEPSASLRWILLGARRKGARPQAVPCSKTRAAWGMTVNSILGVGTPQVLELLAPARLARIAADRALCAGRAVANSECGRFLLGDDPKENVDALERFLAG